jgi:uncharacterized protein YndB with AHSA1/START domain
MPPSDQPIQTFEFVKEEIIDAPIEVVFESLLDELGPEGQMPDGKPMAMKLEPWPGGRWFRDLGDNAGHFWGHVQVIKPPTLLEISGPFFMSYPAANHAQYRLTAESNTTRLKFTHKAIGVIPKEHREGMEMGWNYKLKRVRELAAGRRSAKK